MSSSAVLVINPYPTQIFFQNQSSMQNAMPRLSLMQEIELCILVLCSLKLVAVFTFQKYQLNHGQLGLYSSRATYKTKKRAAYWTAQELPYAVARDKCPFQARKLTGVRQRLRAANTAKWLFIPVGIRNKTIELWLRAEEGMIIYQHQKKFLCLRSCPSTLILYVTLGNSRKRNISYVLQLV